MASRHVADREREEWRFKLRGCPRFGVTQKTAWFMLHRIRKPIDETPTGQRVSGAVEADEPTSAERPVGRSISPMGASRLRGRGKHRTIVMGVRERGGCVRVLIIPNVKAETVQTRIRQNVVPGSTLYTDALHSYIGLRQEYVHHVINHAHEYVRGHVRTNSIESFWSVFKRTIKRTYVAPRPWHLQRFVAEQVEWFNERESTDDQRFPKVTKAADGKRLIRKVREDLERRSANTRSIRKSMDCHHTLRLSLTFSARSSILATRSG